MLDGTMPEISILTKELAMIGGDGDVGVFGHQIEEFFDHAIQVTDSVDLALPQCFELRLIEHFSATRARFEFPAYYMVVQVFENAVDAADARPLLRRFTG